MMNRPKVVTVVLILLLLPLPWQIRLSGLFIFRINGLKVVYIKY
jgi:uncharacterized membrane protein YvlD (DUF360 family)